MAWQAVILQLAGADADSLSEALLEAGAVAVTIEDAHAGTAQESPQFSERDWDAPAAWQVNRLQVLLDHDADADRILREAAHIAGLDPVRALRVEQIEDDDWVRRCQMQFAPLAIADRLWIVPSWHAAPSAATSVVVRLDPGLAFGTGSHPTTRLVLTWLDRTLAQRPTALRVLDYGCGSGILAIAAGKLGAAEVDAVDTDSQAIVTTRENAQSNNVAVRAYLADALPDGEYDIVVANILANPLITLAPLFAKRTRRGGRVALSGLLETQVDDVLAAYAVAFDARVYATEEGWVLIEGIRR